MNGRGVWQAAGALLLVPVCGKLADLYGRRPVFYVTTVMPCVAFIIFLADALVGLSNGPIYFAGIMLTVFLTHGPLGWSMMIDLIPDPVDQARFFPIFNAIQSGSISAICGGRAGAGTTCAECHGRCTSFEKLEHEPKI